MVPFGLNSQIPVGDNSSSPARMSISFFIKSVAVAYFVEILFYFFKIRLLTKTCNTGGALTSYWYMIFVQPS